jgi:hypothetical protein
VGRVLWCVASIRNEFRHLADAIDFGVFVPVTRKYPSEISSNLAMFCLFTTEIDVLWFFVIIGRIAFAKKYLEKLML